MSGICSILLLVVYNYVQKKQNVMHMDKCYWFKWSRRIFLKKFSRIPPGTTGCVRLQPPLCIESFEISRPLQDRPLWKPTASNLQGDGGLQLQTAATLHWYVPGIQVQARKPPNIVWRVDPSRLALHPSNKSSECERLQKFRTTDGDHRSNPHIKKGTLCKAWH